jgi:hypothetical protein
MLTLKIARDDALRPLIPRRGDPTLEEWDNNGLFYGYKQISKDNYHLYLDKFATYRFTPGENEVVAFPEPGIQDHAVFDIFQRAVLPMAVQAIQPEFEILHSSAVLSSRGVIALCGFGHTGKSTLAYAMSKRNYDFWADDTVAFAVKEQRLSAVPLSVSRIRLRQPSIEFFGVNYPEIVAEEGSENSSTLEKRSAYLRALCVLKRSSDFEAGNVVSSRRLYSSEAFSAVLDHAVCFSLNDKLRKRHMMHNYLMLAERVPILEIRFQPGLENLEAILDRIDCETAELSPE